MSALAPGLQAFFTDRLIGQRDASPNTISAYKTSLRLLVRFAANRTAKPPSALDIADLDAPLIAAFLDHLEADRHNSVATAMRGVDRGSADSPAPDMCCRVRQRDDTRGEPSSPHQAARRALRE